MTAFYWARPHNLVRDFMSDPHIPDKIKCDFTRWLILYEKGGLYVDLDLEWFQSPTKLLEDITRDYLATR